MSKHYEVGTRVVATAIQFDDDENGDRRTTPVGTYGHVGAIYPEQDSCYQIEFDNGAWVMLTPDEFANELKVVE